MFTWASKYFLGISVIAYVAAIFYGMSSGGSIVGTLSMGYKGGVGEHTGYAILLGVAWVALMLTVVAVMTRDGDAEEMSALVGSERTLAVRPPSGGSMWGPMTAFGIACLAVGVAVSQAFFLLGLVVLAVVTIEWVIQAWSDRATGDAEVNEIVRDRVVGPFEVPMLGSLAIAVVVLGISRILLTVSEVGSVVVAVVAAAFIFGSAVLIAKGRLPRQIVSAIVAFGAVAVLAGGIIGAVNGERDFHHEDGGSHADDESHSEEGEG